MTSCIRPAHLGLLVSLILFMPQAPAAPMYKWVDENGKVHYGEYAPQKGKVEVIKPVRGNAAEQDDPKDALKKLQEKNKSIDEARQKTREEQKKKADEQARYKKNCEIAKKNLATLQRTKKIRKGDQVVRISDDEWQKKVDEARELMKKFCL